MNIARTSLAGMQTAQLQFTRAANKVSTAFIAPAQSAESEQQTEELTPVSPVPSATENDSTAYYANEADLIEGVVDMQTALASYKANIAVFKTWDEMTETVLSDLKA